MNVRSAFLPVLNGSAVSWPEVPAWEVEDLVEQAAQALDQGERLCAWFGVPEGDGRVIVVAVLASDAEGLLHVARSEPFRGGYASLTPRQPQAHLFERELYEQYGVEPRGHPWPRPVRNARGGAPVHGEFFQVDGAEVHEVGVGPVHAGIIEPGHFRFQCAGEEVLHLEIALGYQHRGVEERLPGGPHRATLAQMEAVAGDTTVGHTTAYAMVVEALAGVEAPLRAQWLRAAALELERLANHVGDLGALANDVAFLPVSAACGRIRGEFLNLTALICGNRFGRRLVVPGGCRFDMEPERASRLRAELSRAMADLSRTMDWLWESATVRSRFEGVGVVTDHQAREIGMVGPAARACGLVRDVRYDQPYGWSRVAQLPVAVWPGGDVLARARVRWLEIRSSVQFLKEQLASAPEGPIRVEVDRLYGEQLAVALVEGWRGEICHVGITDSTGRFRRYKIVDPSFHNWTGLALALRGTAISDFPICNKSFNLSYCGTDL